MHAQAVLLKTARAQKQNCTRAFAHKVLQSQRGVLEQDISPVLTNPSDLSLLDYPRLVRTSCRYSSMDDSLITGQGEYGPVSKSQHLQVMSPRGSATGLGQNPMGNPNDGPYADPSSSSSVGVP